MGHKGEIICMSVSLTHTSDFHLRYSVLTEVARVSQVEEQKVQFTFRES